MRVVVLFVGLSFLYMGTLAHGFSTDRIQDMPKSDRDAGDLGSLESQSNDEPYISAMRTEVDRIMISEEHRELRKALRKALNTLDKTDELISTLDDVLSEDMADVDSDSSMPFYVNYMKRLINGKAKTEKRRTHRKRNSFDSIGHQSGLGGLGPMSVPSRPRKLEFTFENLLPYLIEEIRRTNRAIPTRY